MKNRASDCNGCAVSFVIRAFPRDSAGIFFRKGLDKPLHMWYD